VIEAGLGEQTSMMEAQHEPQFLIYATDAVDRSLTVQELPARLPVWVRAVHFGSISLAMEPGATSLETLMRRESGRRILSVDPNVRPSVIGDRETYRRRFEEWVRLVDIVRLSVVDLEWLYPGAEPAAVARAWLSWGGAGLVVITRGAEGAVAYAAGGATAQTAAPVVQVADTVGAGDSFFAALLAYLYTRDALYNHAQIQNISPDTLSACIAFACAAAAINCSRPGANPPYRKELDL
jgi:fructokinase